MVGLASAACVHLVDMYDMFSAARAQGSIIEPLGRKPQVGPRCTLLAPRPEPLLLLLRAGKGPPKCRDSEVQSRRVGTLTAFS